MIRLIVYRTCGICIVRGSKEVGLLGSQGEGKLVTNKVVFFSLYEFNYGHSLRMCLSWLLRFPEYILLAYDTGQCVGKGLSLNGLENLALVQASASIIDGTLRPCAETSLSPRLACHVRGLVRMQRKPVLRDATEADAATWALPHSAFIAVQEMSMETAASMTYYTLENTRPRSFSQTAQRSEECVI